MSTPNQARIEFGTAGANIAGNIDVLLPQLADHGAEIAAVGNDIHLKLLHLREISLAFRESTNDKIEAVEFDKVAEEIESMLPQLSGKNVAVDTVVNAIKSYCNQLKTLHAQHLHLVDETAPVVPGFPVVNNGVGSGPFETGTAPDVQPANVKGIDPIPSPAGDGGDPKAE